MRSSLIGATLRERRRALGITQAALAARIGISASYLNLIEGDKRSIGGALLKRIADALGLALSEIDGAAERRLVADLAELCGEPLLADLGTGSGAIACALAANAPQAEVYACDASADALQVAQHNARTLQLPIRFAHGSWLQAFGDLRFHLIVSNPPYIRNDDPHLAALTHEPLQALTSGSDGLEDIRQIIAQAPRHLHAGGWLLLEHGYDQAEAVQQLLREQGFSQVQSRRDLAGTARCTGGCLEETP